VYALIIDIDAPLRLRIGRLGVGEIAPGRYLYVGSAQRGLGARIDRHLRRRKQKRWHIDYLTTKVRPTGAVAWLTGRDAECRLARALGEGWPTPVGGFGSSDCRCRGHLVGPVGDEWVRVAESLLGPSVPYPGGGKH
jgi:sugar fermentation stimulation protein A